MKNLYLLQLVLIVCSISCKQKIKTHAPIPFTYSNNYLKAYAFLNHRNDSAFYYFNEVVHNDKDSLQIAMAYNQMATIQSDAGDYFGSQESLLASLKYLNEILPRNRTCLSSDYNELGLSFMRLEDHNTSIRYYTTALHYTDDAKTKTTILNNIAYAYEQKKNFTRALQLYEQALQLASVTTERARLQTNIAYTKWLKNSTFNAAPDLSRALRIRLSANDEWGENSSYNRFSDFYRNSHPDSALIYAGRMYVTAHHINSPDDELTALKKMIELGKPDSAKRYFAKFEKLNDSLQTARSKAKNQFAMIRYNAEKGEIENLKLQTDNSEARYQILWQRVIIGTIVVLIIIAIIVLIFWYRKRKQEQQMATFEAIRETQRRDSKKVHDTLANDVYYILKKIQRADVLDKDWLVNHIDEIYERARDISYELTPWSDENFNDYIAERLTAFANDTIRISLVGNSNELWRKINPICKTELTNILQELMVNMRKHSHANNVVIKFELAGDSCMIKYFDDGIGIPVETVDGNGLKNMGNRIKAIHGEIKFDRGIGKGLQIEITFPTT